MYQNIVQNVFLALPALKTHCKELWQCQHIAAVRPKSHAYVSHVHKMPPVMLIRLFNPAPTGCKWFFDIWTISLILLSNQGPPRQRSFRPEVCSMVWNKMFCCYQSLWLHWGRPHRIQQFWEWLMVQNFSAHSFQRFLCEWYADAAQKMYIHCASVKNIQTTC